MSIINHKITSALATASLLGTMAVAPAFAGPVAGFPSANASPQPIVVDQSKITDAFSITSVGEFIAAIAQLLFLIAGILVFVYLVWGGLQWLTSGGDAGKTEEARNRITAALVGLAIIALAYAIIQIVEYFFGGDIVGNTSVTPRAF